LGGTPAMNSSLSSTLGMIGNALNVGQFSNNVPIGVGTGLYGTGTINNEDIIQVGGRGMYGKDNIKRIQENSSDSPPNANISPNMDNGRTLSSSSSMSSTSSSFTKDKRMGGKYKDGKRDPLYNTIGVANIPMEFNTIEKLNEHFKKFGTITNIQVSHYYRKLQLLCLLFLLFV
jgi:hypothetical protein